MMDEGASWREGGEVEEADCNTCGFIHPISAGEAKGNRIFVGTTFLALVSTSTTESYELTSPYTLQDAF